MASVWDTMKDTLRVMTRIASAVILGGAISTIAEAQMPGCPDYTESCHCPAGCDQASCERACSAMIGTETGCYYTCGACQCGVWVLAPAPGVLKLLQCFEPSVRAVEAATAPVTGRRELSNPDGHFIMIPKAEAQRLGGENAGIGVSLQESNGLFIISGVEKYGPAGKAGLKAGDEIVQVDGKDTKGNPLQAVADWIRGRSGTMVSLVVRGRDGKNRKVPLIRVSRESFRPPKQSDISGKVVPLSMFKGGSCPKTLDGCHLLDVRDGECVFTCRRSE